MPVSGSAAVPLSMFTPPLAPGAYHEHGNLLEPSLADPGMKYGPVRHACSSFNAAALISGV